MDADCQAGSANAPGSTGLATGAPGHRCPLCGAGPESLHARLGEREYYLCGTCHLVWLDPRWHLPPEAERARYQTHQNDPADPRYRAFLARLLDPLQPQLKPGDHGLDYGSGPGPTLSRMLGEAGFPTVDYDPFFAPDANLLTRRYDFITCSETAEHFYQPGHEFARLLSLLRPGGHLAIMTQMLPPALPFSDWYYPRDPTHVCFYAPSTFTWLASHHGLRLVANDGKSVAIFVS